MAIGTNGRHVFLDIQSSVLAMHYSVTATIFVFPPASVAFQVRKPSLRSALVSVSRVETFAAVFPIIDAAVSRMAFLHEILASVIAAYRSAHVDKYRSSQNVFQYVVNQNIVKILNITQQAIWLLFQA